jgi:hypothetical protein
MSETAERTIRISTAAGMLGIDGRTLRAWLEQDRKFTIPRRGRGGSPFVKVADVQAVIATRAGTERKHNADNP